LFHGAIQARFALGNSYNIPAVRILALNGIENFVNFAREMGITTFKDPSNYGLSLTLGGGEVRPIDMAQAFSVFANQGIKQDIIAITKVEDWKGKVYEKINPSDIELNGPRVLDPSVTFLISHTLYDNNARSAAFGETSFLNVKNHPEVSVKTGTTNDRRDNWTVGYTPIALVLTWVGNNDNTPMTGAVSGISGASPIWNKIMYINLEKAEKGYYKKGVNGHIWPNKPHNIIGTLICANTGNVPANPESPDCPVRFEYFLEDSVGANVQYGNKDIPIDKNSKSIASPTTPPDQIEIQNHPFLLDPLGTLICLDCPMPQTPVTIGYP
jgi:membrane peptidoglycan carboxypeptidase